MLRESQRARAAYLDEGADRVGVVEDGVGDEGVAGVDGRLQPDAEDAQHGNAACPRGWFGKLRWVVCVCVCVCVPWNVSD